MRLILLVSTLAMFYHHHKTSTTNPTAGRMKNQPLSPAYQSDVDPRPLTAMLVDEGADSPRHKQPKHTPRSMKDYLPFMLAALACVLAIAVFVLAIELIKKNGETAAPLPSRFAITMPRNYQQTDYTCGPTSLASVLQAYGFNVSEQSLANETNANENDGTLWSQIVNVTVSRELRVNSANNWTLADVFNFIFNNRGGVMVAYQAYKYDDNNASWANDWIDGHYSVIVGWNETGILLMDPSQDDGFWGYIPSEEFNTRWHDVDGCCNAVVHFGMMMWSPTKPLPVMPKGWPAESEIAYTW